MITRLLGMGATLAALGGAGYAGTEYLNSEYFQRSMSPDMSSLESSSGFNALKGTFGGHSIMMNLGAEFGSRYASKKLANRSRATMQSYRNQRGAMRRAQPSSGATSTTARAVSGINKLDKSKFVKSSKSLMKTSRQLRSVGRMAAWAPLAFMAFDMVSALGNMPGPSSNAIPRKGAGLSGTFMDTGMAYTQRQRALQAMHNSQYSGRSALGNEAALMHR